MYGDPRDAVELAILAKIQALTTADGLPETFRLVTRKLTHMADVKRVQWPAFLLQFEDSDPVAKLSYVYEVTLPGRGIIAFAPGVEVEGTLANMYRLTVEGALVSDIHLGGLVDLIQLRGVLPYGLWQEIGVMAVGVTFQVLYEYDPRQPARVA